ncbi:type III-A CRISPR-associated RAMP protein Csm3 [candidate division KSB1 bacterium]|nr:type III-A CRISPR-associated RAMP protein Csm3 [candidate division KSB1 bacterium]
MELTNTKPILGKVIFQGTIQSLTGLHIGSEGGKLEIGGLDSPVVRDPLTRQPYIPGSSLRGKLRSLFERTEQKEFNRPSGQGIYRHECADSKCIVCRVFGSAGGKDDNNIPARLTVADLKLTEQSVKKLAEIDTGLQYTELKFENSLDRITAAANPRQIERVPAGVEFCFQLFYTVETLNQDEIEQDLKNIVTLLNLLQDDYLGGHGSRGYGRISVNFNNENNAVYGRKTEFYCAADENDRDAKQLRIKIEHFPDDIFGQIKKLIEFMLPATS